MAERLFGKLSIAVCSGSGGGNMIFFLLQLPQFSLNHCQTAAVNCDNFVAAAAALKFFCAPQQGADGNQMAKRSLIVAVAEKIAALPREVVAVFAAALYPSYASGKVGTRSTGG